MTDFESALPGIAFGGAELVSELDKIALSLLFYGRRHGGSDLGRQPGAGAAIGAVDQ